MKKKKKKNGKRAKNTNENKMEMNEWIWNMSNSTEEYPARIMYWKIEFMNRKFIYRSSSAFIEQTIGEK